MVIKMNGLILSDGDHAIQAMPLKKGFVNLVAGATISDPKLVYCVTDGPVTVVWSDDTNDTLDLVQGDSFALVGVKSMTIGAGSKIHVLATSVA